MNMIVNYFFLNNNSKLNRVQEALQWIIIASVSEVTEPSWIDMMLLCMAIGQGEAECSRITVDSQCLFEPLFLKSKRFR